MTAAKAKPRATEDDGPEELRRAGDIAAQRMRDARDEWAEKQKRHEQDRTGKIAAPARSSYPSAGSPRWNRWLAALWREEVEDLARWYRDVDVVESLGDHAGLVLRRLLELDEFADLQEDEVQIRWSTSAMVRKDGPHEEVIAGRAKVVPLAERLTWPEGSERAPLFRLELSLPCFVLAEEDELEAPLHALMMQLGHGDNGPYIRKPDIAAFSATLGRYGVRTPREVQAVAHAMAHTDLRAKLTQHAYDPESGQGLLWKPRACAGEMGWN